MDQVSSSVEWKKSLLSIFLLLPPLELMWSRFKVVQFIFAYCV